MMGILADWIEKAVIGLLVIVMASDMALIASMVEWWFKL